jgi:lipopolysaccharide exporter
VTPNAGSDEPPAAPLSKSTFKGLQWTYGASIVGSLLQVGYTAAMGRLLSPADFGVLAIALVFLRFGQYFAQMGVGPALVQSPTMTDRKVQTAFAMNVILSTAVALIFVAIAGLSRNLLDDASVVPVVRVMAVGMVLGGLGTTAEALLRRELRFRQLAINQLISFVVGYLLVGLTSAVLGAGVWSLVAAHLSQTALHTILNVVARPHPVRGGVDRREAVLLVSFGGRVSVIGFTEFLGTSLDTLVIGRVAGGAALGQYNRAYLLVNLPLERLMQGIQSVLFPAFSQIQGERERLARVYRSALGVAAAVLIPTATGMAVAAAPLVRVVLGDQWTLAGQVLPFLAFSAVGSLLALLGAIICEATADLNRKLALQASHVVVLLTLLLAAGSDLRTLAAAVATAQTVRIVGYFALMRRTLGTTFPEHLRILAPAVGTGVAIGAVGIVLNRLLGGLTSLPLLGVHVATGALVLLMSFRVGPLSGVRRDLAIWLDRASALERVPAVVRRVSGLSEHSSQQQGPC